MKLEVKKALAARALKVGKNRILFKLERLSDIKEAITKQDMRDLYADEAILIKEIKGRKKVEKRLNRRRAGSVKGSVKLKKTSGKAQYVIITRKLRSYLFYLRRTGQISKEDYSRYRKEIRARIFRSLSQLKDAVKERSSLASTASIKSKTKSAKSKHSSKLNKDKESK